MIEKQVAQDEAKAAASSAAARTGLVTTPWVAVSVCAVGEARRQRALIESVIREFKRGIDYGRLPQAAQDSLWGPGAAAIIAAFDAYAGERRILSLREGEDRISALIEAPIVSRATGRVIASGIGAASSLEARYKYRWLTRAEAGEMGFGEERLSTFKARRGDGGHLQYRTPNPEYWELLNAVVKMGSKRAEVDAAESLPGVASVLRQLFNNAPAAAPVNPVPRPAPADSPLWSRFWGEVQRLGLTQEEARQKLGVASVKDWLAQGKSLAHAVEVLRQSLAEDERQDKAWGEGEGLE